MGPKIWIMKLKQVFSEVLQNSFFFLILPFSQENICVESPSTEVAGLKACNLIKKRLQYSRFPVNIAKFFTGCFCRK